MTRSVNIDFFAVAEDQRELLQFLLSFTDVRVFESFSELGTDLREFTSVNELNAVLPLGEDPKGQGQSILLQLWSPSVMTDLNIQRISLDPRACQGHTFRYRIDGVGLMQLYFGGVCGKVVTMSHFGHQSQARAEAWGTAKGVNWEGLAKVSGKIQYHLRRTLAAGKVPGRPVLREAMKRAQSGFALKPSIKSPVTFDLLP